MEQLVEIGKVGKAHGLHGSFQCVPITDYPERFESTSHVHIHRGQAPIRTVDVETAQLRSGRVVLKLKGVDTPEAAEFLKHALLCAGEDELVELGEGEYFYFELEGLKVIDEHDKVLGTLKDVLATPAHEIYVISDGNVEVLVPAVAEYILAVEPERGFIRLRLPVEAQDGDFD